MTNREQPSEIEQFLGMTEEVAPILSIIAESAGEAQDIKVDEVETGEHVRGYLYHGSRTDDLTELSTMNPPYRGGLGTALYTAEREEAERYGPNVYRILVDLKNPKQLDPQPVHEGHETSESLLDELKHRKLTFNEWYESQAGHGAEFDHPYKDLDDYVEEHGSLPPKFVAWLKIDDPSLVQVAASLVPKIKEIEGKHQANLARIKKESTDRASYKKAFDAAMAEWKESWDDLKEDREAVEDAWGRWPENNVPIMADSILAGESVPPFWFTLKDDLVGVFDHESMEDVAHLVRRAGYDALFVFGLRMGGSDGMQHEVLLFEDHEPDMVFDKYNPNGRKPGEEDPVHESAESDSQRASAQEFADACKNLLKENPGKIKKEVFQDGFVVHGEDVAPGVLPPLRVCFVFARWIDDSTYVGKMSALMSKDGGSYGTDERDGLPVVVVKMTMPSSMRDGWPKNFEEVARYVGTNLPVGTVVHEVIHHLDHERRGGKGWTDTSGKPLDKYANSHEEIHAHAQEAMASVERLLANDDDFAARVREKVMSSLQSFMRWAKATMPPQFKDNLDAGSRRRLDKKLSVFYQDVVVPRMRSGRQVAESGSGWPATMTSAEMLEYALDTHFGKTSSWREMGKNSFVARQIKREPLWELTAVLVDHLKISTKVNRDRADHIAADIKPSYPPIIINRREGVLDGGHRVTAFRKAGRQTIMAYRPADEGGGGVKSGVKRDGSVVGEGATVDLGSTAVDVVRDKVIQDMVDDGRERLYDDQPEAEAKAMGFNPGPSKGRNKDDIPFKSERDFEDFVADEASRVAEDLDRLPDPIPVWRILHLQHGLDQGIPDDMEGPPAFRTRYHEDVGFHWTYSREAAMEYRRKGMASANYIVSGVASKKDVHWPLTIERNASWPEEKEIYVDAKLVRDKKIEPIGESTTNESTISDRYRRLLARRAPPGGIPREDEEITAAAQSLVSEMARTQVQRYVVKVVPHAYPDQKSRDLGYKDGRVECFVKDVDLWTSGTPAQKKEIRDRYTELIMGQWFEKLGDFGSGPFEDVEIIDLKKTEGGDFVEVHFDAKREDFKDYKPEDIPVKVVEAGTHLYHGTKPENVRSITLRGLSLKDGTKNHGHSMGVGIYLTPDERQARTFWSRKETVVTVKPKRNLRLIDVGTNGPNAHLMGQLRMESGRVDWGIKVADRVKELGFDGIYSHGIGRDYGGHQIIIYDPSLLEFVQASSRSSERVSEAVAAKIVDPPWFTSGKVVDDVDRRSNDAGSILEGEEFNYQWRECLIPVSSLPVGSLMSRDDFEKYGDESRVDRLGSVEEWMKESGGADAALKISPIICLFDDEGEVAVLDGYHRICIAVSEYHAKNVRALIARPNVKTDESRIVESKADRDDIQRVAGKIIGSMRDLWKNVLHPYLLDGLKNHPHDDKMLRMFPAMRGKVRGTEVFDHPDRGKLSRDVEVVIDGNKIVVRCGFNLVQHGDGVIPCASFGEDPHAINIFLNCWHTIEELNAAVVNDQFAHLIDHETTHLFQAVRKTQDSNGTGFLTPGRYLMDPSEEEAWTRDLVRDAKSVSRRTGEKDLSKILADSPVFRRIKLGLGRMSKNKKAYLDKMTAAVAEKLSKEITEVRRISVGRLDLLGRLCVVGEGGCVLSDGTVEIIEPENLVEVSTADLREVASGRRGKAMAADLSNLMEVDVNLALERHRVCESLVEATVGRKMYHVAPRTSHLSIKAYGLVPGCKERGIKADSREGRVYLFEDEATADDAMLNWMVDMDKFKGEEFATVYTIDVSGMDVKPDPEIPGSFYVTSEIDPSKIIGSKRVELGLDEGVVESTKGTSIFAAGKPDKNQRIRALIGSMVSAVKKDDLKVDGGECGSFAIAARRWLSKHGVNSYFVTVALENEEDYWYHVAVETEGGIIFDGNGIQTHRKMEKKFSWPTEKCISVTTPNISDAKILNGTDHVLDPEDFTKSFEKHAEDAVVSNETFVAEAHVDDVSNRRFADLLKKYAAMPQAEKNNAFFYTDDADRSLSRNIQRHGGALEVTMVRHLHAGMVKHDAFTAKVLHVVSVDPSKMIDLDADHTTSFYEDVAKRSGVYAAWKAAHDKEVADCDQLSGDDEDVKSDPMFKSLVRTAARRPLVKLLGGENGLAKAMLKLGYSFFAYNQRYYLVSPEGVHEIDSVDANATKPMKGLEADQANGTNPPEAGLFFTKLIPAMEEISGLKMDPKTLAIIKSGHKEYVGTAIADIFGDFVAALGGEPDEEEPEHRVREVEEMMVQLKGKDGDAFLVTLRPPLEHETAATDGWKYGLVKAGQASKKSPSGEVNDTPNSLQTSHRFMVSVEDKDGKMLARRLTRADEKASETAKRLHDQMMDKAANENVLAESVLLTVEKAAEILGDMKLALRVAETDPYQDKRMTPTIATWLKEKKIQAPDEHRSDILKFKELRGKLKGTRVPITNKERTAELKDLLAFDPTHASDPAEISAWNDKARRFIDPNADASDTGLAVAGKHGGYTMYEIKTKADLEVPLVKNTMSWCVTKDFFGRYGGPPYYAVVRDEDKSPFAMIIPAYFKKDRDQAVRNGMNTGRLSPSDLKKISPLVQKVISKDALGNKTYIRTIHGEDHKRPKAPTDPERVIRIIKDQGISPGEWPEGEKVISGDPKVALKYAIEVINGPWPMGEDAIASTPWTAYKYIASVLKRPWPRAEKMITRSYAYEYAHDILHGRFEPGEDSIAKSGHLSYLYATTVIHGRFVKGEPAILETHWAYNYAIEVMDRKWPECERSILETIIKNNKIHKESVVYVERVIQKRWPKLEEAMAKILKGLKSKGDDPESIHASSSYAKSFRWQDGIDLINSIPEGRSAHTSQTESVASRFAATILAGAMTFGSPQAVGAAPDKPTPTHAVQSKNAPSWSPSYLAYVKQAENGVRSGWKDGKWHPHGSVEGGRKTIAYGHKIKDDAEQKRFDQGITEAEAEKLLKADLAVAWRRAEGYVMAKCKVELSSLPMATQEILTDYAFNLGSLDGFPKFVQATVKGDEATMKKEYKRKVGDQELKDRNERFAERYLGE